MRFRPIAGMMSRQGALTNPGLERVMNRLFDHILRALLCALLLSVPVSAVGADIKVMTFNVRLPLDQDGANDWEHRRGITVAAIAGERPDIVATQELHKPQGDYLVERLPEYSWFGIDRRGGHADEHMGIFYRRDRLALLYHGDYWLSDTPLVPGSISWGHPYPRMVTWGLFETKAGNRRFYVLNTHFPYREEDEAARLKAARMIASWIPQLRPDIPVILLGDFNTVPGGPVHATFQSILDDAWLAAVRKDGPAETFHAFTGKADRRIDWILSRGLRAKSVRTLTDNRAGRYPSDHFPVVATLAWPPR